MGGEEGHDQREEEGGKREKVRTAVFTAVQQLCSTLYFEVVV